MEETIENSTENFPYLKVGVGGVERKKIVLADAMAFAKTRRQERMFENFQAVQYDQGPRHSQVIFRKADGTRCSGS